MRRHAIIMFKGKATNIRQMRSKSEPVIYVEPFLGVQCPKPLSLGNVTFMIMNCNIKIPIPSTVSPFSPWENRWQLRQCYKDHSKRMVLARQLERQILLLAVINLLLAPLVQAWQILYFFFNYAEVCTSTTQRDVIVSILSFC